MTTLRDTAAKALTDAGLGDVPMQAIDIVTAVAADWIVAAREADGPAFDPLDRAYNGGLTAAAALIRTAPPTEAAKPCRITVETQGNHIGRRHCHTHDMQWEGAFAVGGGCPATEASEVDPRDRERAADVIAGQDHADTPEVSRG